MEYVKLESEKYLHQKIDQQVKVAKHHRDRKAVRDLVTFLVGLSLIPVCIVLAYQLPIWFPGLAAAFETAMNQLLPGQVADSIATAAN